MSSSSSSTVGRRPAGGTVSIGFAGLLAILLLAIVEPVFNPRWQSNLALFEWLLLLPCVLTWRSISSNVPRTWLALCALYLAAVSWSCFLNLLGTYPLTEPTFALDLAGRLGGTVPFDQAEPFFTVRAFLTVTGGVLAFLLAAATNAEHLGFRRLLLTASVSAGLIVASVGLAQALFGVAPPDLWRLSEPGLFRVGSTLEDPNAAASLILLSVPLAGVWAWRAEGWRRIGASLITAILVGGTIVTASRAAILAILLLAGSAAVIILRPRIAPRRALMSWIALAVGVLCLAAGLTWAASSLSRSSSQSSVAVWVRKTFEPDASLDRRLRGRVEIWKKGLQMALDAPLFGAGPGTSYRRLVLYGTGTDPVQENLHQQFLQDWAEIGLVGLALELGLIGSACWWGWRRGGSQERAVVCGVAAFLLTGLFGHPGVLAPVRFWFWALLGYLAVSGSAAPTLGALSIFRRSWHWIALLLALAAGTRVLEAVRLGSESCVALGLFAPSRVDGMLSWYGKTPFTAHELGWAARRSWFRVPIQGECLRWSLEAPRTKASPTNVRIALDGHFARSVHLSPGKVSAVDLCMPWLARRGTVAFTVDADSVSEPSPEDPRSLGVWLGALQWQTEPELCACEGFHPPDIGQDWIWSRQSARVSIRTDRAEPLAVLIAHPDSSSDPIQLRCEIDGLLLPPVTAASPGWYRIPWKATPGLHAFRFGLSRTWSPARYGVSADPREIGIGIPLSILAEDPTLGTD